GLFPTGFVHVLDRRRFYRFEDFGVGRLQSLAHFLFQSTDGAQGDGSAEHFLRQLLGRAFGKVVATGQIGQDSRQTGAATVGANVVGNGCVRNRAAGGTGASVPLVFRDVGLQL